MDETTLVPLSIEERELVYRDRNQEIRKIVAHFDGFDKEYYVSDHGLRTAVLVVQNDNVLLVRQYRLLINGLSYEIPGGGVDHDETTEEAAIRECFEETGVKCWDLKPLISYHPSLDIWKNYTYVFYSERVDKSWKKGSDRIVWVPLTKCVEMVNEQKIVDSLSIIALLTYTKLANKC